jgi:hypothetical protein
VENRTPFSRCKRDVYPSLLQAHRKRRVLSRCHTTGQVTLGTNLLTVVAIECCPTVELRITTQTKSALHIFFATSGLVIDESRIASPLGVRKFVDSLANLAAFLALLAGTTVLIGGNNNLRLGHDNAPLLSRSHVLSPCLNWLVACLRLERRLMDSESTVLPIERTGNRKWR